MPSKIITEEMKQQIREFYLSKPMTLAAVEKHFNLSHPTISKILKDVPKYSKARLKNPNMDERFFKDINREDKAYFIGMLISDGNVFVEDSDSTANRQASISISLDLGDEYMLNNFKKAVNANTSIGHDGRGCGQIAVRSNLMAQDLQQYGIVPRKTFSTYLPTNIDDSMMNHVIRGIFDGDGSIMAKLMPDGRFLHAISFCGTHKLMEDISLYLTEHLHLKQPPKVYDYKNKALSEIKIANIEDIQKLGNWMYKDATIFLVRKRNIYDDFKNHYNLS